MLSLDASRRTYGSPRVAHDLGCPGGRNRIARLMRRDHLRARQRSKYRVATTDSRHADPIAPNRLMGVRTTRTNEAWVTDVTPILGFPQPDPLDLLYRCANFARERKRPFRPAFGAPVHYRAGAARHI
jgi:transposase InsO family protein